MINVEKKRKFLTNDDASQRFLRVTKLDNLQSMFAKIKDLFPTIV